MEDFHQFINPYTHKRELILMKVEIESELVSNGETWEIFLELSYFKN